MNHAVSIINVAHGCPAEGVEVRIVSVINETQVTRVSGQTDTHGEFRCRDLDLLIGERDEETISCQITPFTQATTLQPLRLEASMGQVAIPATSGISACCCDSPHFTEKEVEIIVLLAGGSDTDKVAATLCMSPHTTTHHLSNMLRKSGSGNRTELVARAYASGVLLAGMWPPRWSGRFCLWPETAGVRRSHRRDPLTKDAHPGDAAARQRLV